MPGPFDFKGQKIQDTYGRVVQIATGSLYDGKGTLINADIQAIADASDQRQSESIELSAISSSVFELQQFSSSLDADFATDAELSALSSSILVTTNDLSSSIQDNENELSNQDGRITSLTAATSSYVVFPYTGSAIITGSLEVIGDITASNSVQIGPQQVTLYGRSDRTSLAVNRTPYFYAGNNAFQADLFYTYNQGSANQPALYIGTNGGGAGRGIYAAGQGLRFSANNSTTFYFNGATNTGTYGPSIGIGTDPEANLDIKSLRTPHNYFRISGSTSYSPSAEVLIVSKSGDVGIGTWSPNHKLEVIGDISASTYYGDGSNLTGIETDPFPYTGSAIISGSLEVDGNIELTKKINGVGITTSNNNNSIYLATADSDTLSVGNYQTIIHGGIGGNYAVHIGRSAGNGRTSTQNVVIGTNAGSYGGSGDAGSTLVGHSAGIGSNSYSTIIGNSAGTGVKGVYTSVQENVIIGRNAGGNVINYSTTIGSFSGRALLGDYNITVGHHTGYNGIGDNLIFLGKEAGYNASGSNNILIGYQAGYNLTGSNQLIIANNSSSALITGDFANNTLGISGSVSASTYYGDGSNLTGISTTPFPYIGSAIITGSLTVSGSVVDFTSASAVNLNIDSLPLINPIVEYLDVTSSIASGTTLTLPNNLSYISSSTYEYLEIFMNGLRTRYNIDFVPMSNTTIQTQIAFPSGSELTFKSLKR